MVAIGSSRGQLAVGAEFILTSIEDKAGRAARQQAVVDAEFGIKAPGIWVVGQLDPAYCLFDMCGVLKSNIPWRVQIVRECNFPGLIEDWL